PELVDLSRAGQAVRRPRTHSTSPCRPDGQPCGYSSPGWLCLPFGPPGGARTLAVGGGAGVGQPDGRPLPAQDLAAFDPADLEYGLSRLLVAPAAALGSLSLGPARRLHGSDPARRFFLRGRLCRLGTAV